MQRHQVPRLSAVASAVLAIFCSADIALAEPTVDIVRPAPNELHAGWNYVDVQVVVSDPLGLKSIEIALNGRTLQDEGRRGIELRERVLPRLNDLQAVERFPIQFQIPVGKLKEGGNDLSFRVENFRGEIAEAHRRFLHAAPKGTIYVAAIGIDRYLDSAVPGLKYAESDARSVADYFRDHVGVPAENIFTLLGEAATARNIKKLLGVTLRRKAGRHDQVVIYYAGHGVPEYDHSLAEGDQVEKYLMPWDGEVEALYATAVPMREVDYLSRRFVSERVVFLLDTCFSGGASARDSRARTIPAKSGLRSFRRHMDDGFLKRMAAAKGKVILTASGINEPSHELDALGHGVFTYYLLQGMEGAADFDGNGIVGISEIYKYLNDKVPAHTGHGQTPTYFVSETVVGEIILGRSALEGFRFELRDPWSGAGDDGRLVLQAEPPDVNVFINGVSRATSRGFINARLRAGVHRIKVQKAGYETVEMNQPINKRAVAELNVSLEPVTAQRLVKRPPPPP